MNWRGVRSSFKSNGGGGGGVSGASAGAAAAALAGSPSATSPAVENFGAAAEFAAESSEAGRTRTTPFERDSHDRDGWRDYA